MLSVYFRTIKQLGKKPWKPKCFYMENIWGAM